MTFPRLNLLRLPRRQTAADRTDATVRCACTQATDAFTSNPRASPRVPEQTDRRSLWPMASSACPKQVHARTAKTSL